MKQLIKYQLSKVHFKSLPNIWDIMVLIIIFGILAAISWGAKQMTLPYQIGSSIDISLDLIALPKYAISTVLRMFIALFFSLLFTFIVAPLAAKNKTAERFIIPFIDIMQSIPVLGLLAITVVGFIYLFPGSLLGPECAAIFAIFTAQVWNMTLSLYQAIKTIPKDLTDVAKMYRLSGWQKFWRLEVPFGTPGLLWNTMMSMSAGWFFVVLSEAISVANQHITLPGIGSYISKAILEANLPAIGYAIVAMFIVIVLYDQLLFRPILSWADKFQSEIYEDQKPTESWFYNVLARTNIIKKIDVYFDNFVDFFINEISKIINPNYKNTIVADQKKTHPILTNIYIICWYIIFIASLVAASYMLVTTIYPTVSIHEILYVFYLGFITAIKVIVLIIAASLIWIPVGVWIGLHPKAKAIIQPLIQFLAAFPANLLYPLFVVLILRYTLNIDIWTTPLMILGTQWYILFNVIAGTSNIPKDLRMAAKNFNVKGYLWWKRLILPSIFPFYTTGAMAAAGGCWNASIVAEFVQWGDDTLVSVGIGSYIEAYTRIGDFPRITLGIAVMSLYVIFFNRLLWQRLYNLAENRFSMN